MKILNNIKLLGVTFIMLFLASCGDEDFPVPQSSEVSVKFSFSFEGEGFTNEQVTFFDESIFAENITNKTYLWNFGDGTSSTESNPSHVFTNPGDYTIKLVIETENDIDFAEQLITVRDPNALQVSLYFMDAGDGKIYNTDGGSIDASGFSTGIAYDESNQLIYYTDADNGTLMSVNLDGSNETTVVGGFADPRDIALDVANQKAYVTDRGSGVHAVIEVDLNNNTSSILYDNASNGLGELPVGIDFHDGNIYVTCVEIDAEAVWKGNVDGSGITRIIDYGAGGYGYGIAVDKVNGRIYFDNTDNSEILSADLNGGDIKPFAITTNRAYGIAVDNTNGKVYWSERNTGSLFMANLDGSSQKTIISSFNDPRGIFFID